MLVEDFRDKREMLKRDPNLLAATWNLADEDYHTIFNTIHICIGVHGDLLEKREACGKIFLELLKVSRELSLHALSQDVNQALKWTIDLMDQDLKNFCEPPYDMERIHHVMQYSILKELTDETSDFNILLRLCKLLQFSELESELITH